MLSYLLIVKRFTIRNFQVEMKVLQMLIKMNTYMQCDTMLVIFNNIYDIEEPNNA